MQLPEALTFYYGHVGYYFNQFSISWSMPVLTCAWLLVLLSDCEPGFEAFQLCNSEPGRTPAAEIMAETVSRWFSWLIFLFLLATSIPLVTELWLERSLKVAIKKLLVQLLTLSPLLFIFQAKTIGSYVVNEIRFGGATYVSTGRGLPTERRPFILHKNKKFGGLYLDYAMLAYYDGVMLLCLSLFVVLAGGLSDAGIWKGQLVIAFLSLGLTISSWLYAPFLFNPYMFSPKSFLVDLGSWCTFFFAERGEHWTLWYTEKQLKPDKGRRIGIDAASVITCLLLFTWYELVSLKVMSFATIYGEVENSWVLQTLVFFPPVAASGVLCILLPLFEGVVRLIHRCIQLMFAQDGVAHEAGVDIEAADSEPNRGCGAMPLAPISVMALVLDALEAAWTLRDFYSVGWTDGVIAGVALKLLVLSIFLCWCEDFLRSPFFQKMGCLGLPVQLWVRAHRMSRDLVTSTIILSTLTPLVFLNALNDFLTPGCSIHQLLIFRDHKPPARQDLHVSRMPNPRPKDMFGRNKFGKSFWHSEKTSMSERTHRTSVLGSERTFRSERTDPDDTTPITSGLRTPCFNPLGMSPSANSPSGGTPSDGQFTFQGSVSHSRASGSDKISELLSSDRMSPVNASSEEQSEQSSPVKSGWHNIKKMPSLPSIMSAAQESGNLSARSSQTAPHTTPTSPPAPPRTTRASLPKSALSTRMTPHGTPRGRTPMSARSVFIDPVPEMVRFCADVESPDDSEGEELVMDIGESPPSSDEEHMAF